MITVDWRRYLDDYHDRWPGITEWILRNAISRHDETQYEWLAEPLQDAPGRILDLACGSAPTRDLPRRRGWLGLDVSTGELTAAVRSGRGPLVRARGDALPLPDRAINAVCGAMCLQVGDGLARLLREHGFLIHSDRRCMFRREIVSATDAALLIDCEAP